MSEINLLSAESLLFLVPVSPQYLIAVAGPCEQIGFYECAACLLFNTGKYLAITGHFLRARTILQAALNNVERIPSREASDYGSLTASILNSFGAVLSDLREFREAGAILSRCLELRRKLAVDQEGTEQYLLVNVFHNLANLRLKTGDLASAGLLSREALALLDKLEEVNGPANALYQARSLSTIGEVAKASGDIRAATDAFRQGLAKLRSLYEVLEPESNYAAPDLTTALCNVAQTQILLGNATDAIALYEQALEVVKHLPERHREWLGYQYPFMLDGLAQALCMDGQMEKCLLIAHRAILNTEQRMKDKSRTLQGKAACRNSYLYILNDAVEKKDSSRVFSCLAALRDPRSAAFSDFSQEQLGAALEELMATSARAGSEICVLIVEQITKELVLFAQMSKQEFDYQVCSTFIEPAKELYLEILDMVYESNGIAANDVIGKIRQNSGAVWRSLPEPFRETLGPGFSGTILLSCDPNWSSFPWEALFDTHQAMDWIGRHHTLARWPDISASGFRRLKRSESVERVAGVVCPWDAVPGMELPEARVEAEEVVTILKSKGYMLISGRSITGPEATKSAMLDVISKQPRILHYTGHGAIQRGEEILIFAANEGFDSFGVADLRLLHQQQWDHSDVLAWGPVVVLNSCFTGSIRSYGAVREDLVSALLAEGAEVVIACPFPVHDSMGRRLASGLYAANTETIAQAFLQSRSALEEHFAREDATVWPLWALFHYHGNPFARLH
jgi:tetratricopeptide (TPR) repeat protein